MAHRSKRFDVGPVFRHHWEGLQDRATGKITRDVIVFTLVLPVVLGILSGVIDMRLSTVAPILSGVTILVGAMLTLYVFVSNLRVKVSEVAELRHRRKTQRLLAYIAASSLYVALVSLVVAGLLGVAGSFRFPDWGLDLSRIGTGILVTSLAHLVTTLISVIRRLFAVYVDFFPEDFGPDNSQDARSGHLAELGSRR